jgi:hypothetical protein
MVSEAQCKFQPSPAPSTIYPDDAEWDALMWDDCQSSCSDGDSQTLERSPQFHKEVLSTFEFVGDDINVEPWKVIGQRLAAVFREELEREELELSDSEDEVQAIQQSTEPIRRSVKSWRRIGERFADVFRGASEQSDSEYEFEAHQESIVLDCTSNDGSDISEHKRWRLVGKCLAGVFRRMRSDVA